MIQLPVDADDAQILTAIRGWCELLVKEDYAAAIEALLPDSYYCWTPELLKTVLENYGSPEPIPQMGKFKVTPLESAKMKSTRADGSEVLPTHKVSRYTSEPPKQFAWGPTFDQSQQENAPEGTIGYVWFDLPLNGSWSDLTALFDLQIMDQRLVFRLTQLRVM